MAQELALPNVLNRKQNYNNCHKTIKTAIDLFLAESNAKVPENPTREIQTYSNRRCGFCARSRDIKQTYHVVHAKNHFAIYTERKLNIFMPRLQK